MSGLGALYDPTDPESRRAAVQVSMEVNRLGLEKYKWTILPPTGAVAHDMLGPLQSNYPLWLRKIKEAFDPNVASDPTSYIKP